MRYLYRCTTDKLLEHIARIEEAGDRVLSEHFVGGRDWVLVCSKPADLPGRASLTGYVLDVLKAHTWWHDRNRCECGETPADHTMADGRPANVAATDWHAEHVAAELDGHL